MISVNMYHKFKRRFIMENMDNKLKALANKIFAASMTNDIATVMDITAAVDKLLDAEFDPHRAVTKLSCYLHDFIKAKNSQNLNKAAWRALGTAIRNMVGDDISQWRWYDRFEVYLQYAHSVELAEEEKQETEKKAKEVQDVFASLGL